MSIKKREDSNSAKSKVRITRNAIDGITIPECLDVDEDLLLFLRPILDLREYSTWNQSDISKAVNLAKCQRDIVRLSAEIRQEGDVIENKKGTPVANPKHALLDILSRRELALSRAIHVHAEATQGRSREQGGRSKQQAATLHAIDSARSKAKGLIGGL